MQLLHKTICEECAFYIKLECTHPDELAINCATVTFCNSFTPAVEIDSPCVSFGNLVMMICYSLDVLIPGF
ncbi:hypothetical protein AA650_08605 [Anabaena sp. WA102]|jgi:hypothetical protein|nr:hypothetical protein [Anabaena sp. WA102]ALB40525.1 hypothetical protein AA650_08605 [Anabaena sp. WA102]